MKFYLLKENIYFL